MSQENVEAVRAVYEEWARGNFRGGSELFDPHLVFLPRHNLPDAKNLYVGVDGMGEFMRLWLREWNDFRISPEEFIEAANDVVVAVHQQGVGRESDTPAEDRYFQVWTFRGRSVVRLEGFGNRAEALEAVGLSE